MNLRETIDSKLKIAMKEGNDDQKRVFRLILASAKLAEVENRSPLDDTGLMSIIQKEVKIRREALEGAQAAHRDDLIAKNLKEISILEDLLPRQLSDDDLTALVSQIIRETGASGPADTRKIMKALMPKVQGRAAGDRVSLIVRQALQNLT